MSNWILGRPMMPWPLGELDLSAAKRKLLFQLICGKVTTAIDANTGAASKLGSVAGEG